jgi:hydrogenase maturation protease
VVTQQGATLQSIAYKTHRERREMCGKTLILGLGNTLLGDEGVGVHSVNRLQQEKSPSRDVVLMDGGTLSFVLAGPIEEAGSLIVIDAAQLGSPPGSVQVFEGAEMDRFVANSRHKSVHEVTLFDLLTIAHLSGDLPSRRALIGVQPEHIDWSDSLSTSVAAAVPKVCDSVRDVLLRWTPANPNPVTQMGLAL